MRPRAFTGLLLCAFLLGATWPTLAALPGVPSRIVLGDAYAITQGTGALSINTSLAENLTAEPWATIVSPEILGLGTLSGEPVVVRAADPDAFFRLEGATPMNATVPFAFVGSGLSARLHVAVGDAVTLVGSYLPRIAFLRISGIYRTETPANDEMLVDFGTGRFLTAIGPVNFHTIRVRTSNPTSLLAFLDGFGSSVHVSGPAILRSDVHSGPPPDERIANLILRTGIGGAPRDYLTTAVAQAATSIAVVAYGIAALLGVLVAFGVHAVQARAFADRVSSVGVLRAVGAGNRWMRRRLLIETIPFAAFAAGLGSVLGVLLAWLLQPNLSLVVFGHQVPVTFDPVTLGVIVLAVVAVSIVSALVLLHEALRGRPTESIRETPAVEAPQSLEVIL